MKTTWYIIAALAITLAVYLPSRADRVRTRSGKEIEGVLIDSGAQMGASGKVRLWVGTAQIALPLDQVILITTDTAANNLLIDTSYQLEGRRAEEGAEKLGLAVQQGATRDQVAGVLSKYGDLLADAIPQMKLPGREGLSQALATLEGQSAAQNRAMAAQRIYLHVALGEGDKADAILNDLGPQYFTRHPAEGARMSSALVRTLEAWAEVEDFASGETSLVMLQKIDPRRAVGASIQFYLHWGSCERRSGRFESALRVYTQHMMAQAPEIAADRTTTTLIEAERSAREKNRLLDVVGLYETYGRKISPGYTNDRLALIWHDEGLARMWDNKLAPAREAFTTAEKYKKGIAARELLQCEWRERRAKLKPGDGKGHHELGQWCQEQELFNEALTEFHEAEGTPQLAADAAARIATIESKIAEAKLSEIMAFYEKREFMKVIDETRKFLGQEHPAGFLAQAKQIQDLARESMVLQVAQRPQAAEALYKQAERACNEEEYAKARGLLDTIMTHYSDTVTYARAAALSALVDQRLAVAAMEAGRKPKPAAAPTTATQARTNAAPTTATAARIAKAANNPTSATQRITKKIPVKPAPKPKPTPKPTTPRPGETPEKATISDALKKLMGQEGIGNGQ